jgi:hypothetical protein
MIAWVFGVPAALMLMVLVLDKVESAVVTPAVRAATITRMVEEAPPDQIERAVSVLLAPQLSSEENLSRARSRAVAL